MGQRFSISFNTQRGQWILRDATVTEKGFWCFNDRNDARSFAEDLIFPEPLTRDNCSDPYGDFLEPLRQG